MKINRISPSSYNSWDGCQHKYFLEQNLKYTYPPGKAADIGTVTHKVLEILSLIKLQEQEDPENRSLKVKDTNIDVDDYNIDKLINIAISGFKEGYFVQKDLCDIRKYIDTALTFSNGEYDPRNRTIVAPEKRVKVEVPESWATLEDGSQFFLSGIIDLVMETKNGGYEILDWKTSRQADFNTGKVKDYRACMEDPQLRFYHWAASKIYGEDKEFLVSIFFLKTGTKYTIPFDPDDLPKTEYLLRERFEEIKACSHPKLNRSWKCKKFCPFGQKTTHGTNFPVMEQVATGGIAPRGAPMTICDCSNYHIHMYGIDFVQEHFAKYKK